MILVGGQVLMTSTLNVSELVLAEKGCELLRGIRQPRVLIGGLGLGFTLRAALDELPRDARVVVAELNSKVVEWCRGPVACVNNRAALDKRVRIVVGDVTTEIARVALDPAARRYDAILWDLYVGPPRRGGSRHPLFGDSSVKNVWESLKVGGVFGVWGETPSPAFEARLKRHGFAPELVRTDRKSLCHAVYLATKRSSTMLTRTGKG